MKRYTYTVHIEPAEEGGYVVTVPALPGCVTQGETYEEAVGFDEHFDEPVEMGSSTSPASGQPSCFPFGRKQLCV